MENKMKKVVFRKWLAVCLSLIIALGSMATCFSTAVLAAEEEKVNDIETGETKTISVNGNTVYLKFTPMYSGKYKFYAVNGGDTYGYLCDEDKATITTNDDGGDNNKFSITYELEAGTTYYWGARYYNNSGSGSFDVRLECLEIYCSHENTTYVESEQTNCYVAYYTSGYWCEDCKKWISGHQLVNASHFDENADNICDLCSKTMPYNTGSFDSSPSSGSLGGSDDFNDYLISYNMYSDGTLEIYGNGEIREDAFYSNKDIRKVIVYDGITSIGRYAFSACENLESVELPDSLETISTCAFYNCKSLETIEIPDSVTSIYYSAFKNCTSLESIEIPDSVTSIGEETFYNCESLKSVTIGNSVTSIGSSAFRECTSLESIEIPDSVTSIGSSAFRECTSLTSAIIGDSVTSIDYYAFYNCSSLTSAIIGDSVTSIASHTFSNCTSLTSATIGNSVTSIGYEAFSNCTSLNDVYIKDLVTWCNIEYADIYAWPLCYAENLYLNGELVKNVVIPEGVTSIGSYVFRNCTTLESIVIPDSVTSIGSYAFSNCESLKSVTIGNGVTSIGSYAFRHCHYADIVISAGVTGINSDAFRCGEYDECDEDYSFYCYKDSYAHTWLIDKGYDFALVDGTTEENTVSGRIGAYSWSLNKLTGVLKLSGSGKMVDFTSADAPWYEYSSLIKELDLPEGLTNIGQRAFRGLYRVNDVVIPDSVTLIDENAFSMCGSLDAIVIPDSVTSIGEDAFSYCTRLESVTIGNSVTSIGSYAFCDCKSLESIVIPDSVTSIGSYAFAYCSRLTSAEIGNSVTSIDSYAFEDCTSLESIVIPDSVTSIGYNVFYYCSNLKTIEFGLDEKNSSKFTYMPDIYGTDVKTVFLPASIASASSDVFPSDIEEVTVCNPEFRFSLDCGLNYNSTIIGFSGSTAETFAAEIGAAFVDIETVHNHEYKSIEEKGYCSFGRCICGKEEKVAHTDSDRNAICDGCSKNLNDINVDTPIKVLVEDGSINYYEFTAVQEGRYTLTVNQECYYIALYNEENSRISGSYNVNQLSYNLQAGQKVRWRVQNANIAYVYGSVIPKIEIELTLTYAPNHEHSYTSTVTTQATCTTNGVKTYTCTCGDSYTQTIWSNGHSYGSWYVSVAGSCSAGVVIKRDCVNCDYSDTMSFSSSGKHKEVTTISRATDTHDGSVITSCSVCGQKIEEKTIAKIASVELSETKYTYNGKVKTPSVTVKDSEGKKLDKDTDYTVTYSSGRKNPGVYSVTVKFKGNYGGTEKLTFKILPKAPTSFDYTASSKSSVKLSWDASTGATGYIVYKYNSNAKKYEKIAIVDGEKSYTVSSLKAGSSYKFKIRAYKELKDNTVVYSDYSSAITAYTKTATPTLKVSSGSAGVASLSWSNVAGETGYEVYYSTSKSSGYKKLGTYKTDVVKASKKKLTSGKKYYFKVRAYKKTSDRTIYGGWSSVKSVKIK